MRISIAIAAILLTSTVAGQAQPRTPGMQPGQYATEAEAKRACPMDTVVWANNSTHVLHAPGDQYYGRTKNGAFTCRAAAMQAGMHMDKHN